MVFCFLCSRIVWSYHTSLYSGPLIVTGGSALKPVALIVVLAVIALSFLQHVRAAQAEASLIMPRRCEFHLRLLWTGHHQVCWTFGAEY